MAMGRDVVISSEHRVRHLSVSALTSVLLTITEDQTDLRTTHSSSYGSIAYSRLFGQLHSDLTTVLHFTPYTFAHSAYPIHGEPQHGERKLAKLSPKHASYWAQRPSFRALDK
jgi:hypothetical protein